ncbi:MAG: dipeptidase [Filifactoraceae bacterium]
MIFDCHADVLVDVTNKRLKGKRNILKADYIDRYKQVGVTGSIFVLWTEPKELQTANEERLAILRKEGITELKENEDILRIVYTVDDFYKAIDEDKLAVMLGVEGLCGIGEELNLIDKLYEEGVRHVGLTWNEENSLATGIGGRSDRGLTPLGIVAVKKLEDLGVVIDVSHLNDTSFWDVVKIAKKPLIASHSNSRSLCDVPRNLTDDQIKAIGNTGGVIGINSIRQFVGIKGEEQNVKRLIDHVDYIVKLVGIDHVGFGFDFCDMLDEDLGYDSDTFHNRDYELYSIESVSLIIRKLEERGYSSEDLEKLKYKNFFRVFKEIIG